MMTGGTMTGSLVLYYLDEDKYKHLSSEYHLLMAMQYASDASVIKYWCINRDIDKNLVISSRGTGECSWWNKKEEVEVAIVDEHNYTVVFATAWSHTAVVSNMFLIDLADHWIEEYKTRPWWEE